MIQYSCERYNILRMLLDKVVAVYELYFFTEWPHEHPNLLTVRSVTRKNLDTKKLNFIP